VLTKGSDYFCNDWAYGCLYFLEKMTEMSAKYGLVIMAMSAQRTAEARLIVNVHEYIV